MHGHGFTRIVMNREGALLVEQWSNGRPARATRNMGKAPS